MDAVWGSLFVFARFRLQLDDTNVLKRKMLLGVLGYLLEGGREDLLDVVGY